MFMTIEHMPQRSLSVQRTTEETFEDDKTMNNTTKASESPLSPHCKEESPTGDRELD